MQKINVSELELMLSRLKLKRPDALQKITYTQQQHPTDNNIINDYSFSKEQQSISIVQDNYSDSNCFSFYNYDTQNKNNKTLTKKDYPYFLDNEISQFGSIIDKLKTQGDCSQTQQKYFLQKSQYQTGKLNSKVAQQIAIDRQFYFSQKQLKPHTKSYKNISSMKKKKMGESTAISNKLIIDKQNFHIYSNQSHHCSVKKLKKTFNQNSISNQRYKNQRAQTQTKVRNQDKKIDFNRKTTSPLPFRHSKIEPHKFSSYKMKLF